MDIEEETFVITDFFFAPNWLIGGGQAGLKWEGFELLDRGGFEQLARHRESGKVSELF